MNTTRRTILKLGLGGSTLLARGASVPTFLARSSLAMDPDRAAASKGRVLVVLQLDGGNDGLNTVVPYRDDDYRKLRPGLRLDDKDVRKVDDRVGLHPELGGFSTLLESGRLAIVQGVGYPNPNRSHFESMATWQSARIAPGDDAIGWLARALDARPGLAEGDAPALHVDDSACPLALEGGQARVPSLVDLDQFRRRLGAAGAPADPGHREALDRLARQRLGEPGSLLEFVERSATITYTSSARLQAAALDGPSSRGYPEYFGLARRLKLIARLIKAGLTTTIYYAQVGGFDTHANQVESHGRLLREVGDSLRAFLDDLKVAGEADRVLVLAFSEFGRRPVENASGGTDHGTSGPVFLLGDRVKAGLHGTHPDLSRLEDGDPRHTVDFRRVYASVLDHWLGTPPLPILGEGFEPLPLIRT